MSVGRIAIARHAASATAVVMSLLAAIGCATSPASSAHRASEAHFLNESGESRLTLRMLTHTGYPTVAAWLDDAPARFIIDTGGRDTMITSSDLIDRAKQAARHQPSLRLSGTRYPAQSVRKLHVGDALVFDEVATIVTDMNNISALEGEQLDGWLTMAALGNVTIDVDLPDGVGALRRPNADATTIELASLQRTGASPLRRPAGLESDPRPFAILHVGDHDVPTLIDTGCYDAITMSRAMFDATGATLRDPRPSRGTGGFGSTLQPSVRGAVDKVTLGDTVLSDVAVHVVPHETMRYAVVGMPVLRHYRLVYDSPSRRLWLIGPAQLSGAAPSESVVRFVEKLAE